MNNFLFFKKHLFFKAIFFKVIFLLFIGSKLFAQYSPTPILYQRGAINLADIKLPDSMFFCGEKIPLNDPDVRKRMERELYLNLQSDGQILLYLKRSGEYFNIFEQILKEEEAPDDLKFLSVAESALYMSQSSKGAVGLWQFMPETGRRYGLRIDEYVDERRNVEKSTKAAIKYLRTNKERFNSWALAAASYNMGEGATDDDLTFQRQNSFYDLYVNEETSRYVFRIAAIKEIMSNMNKYGIYLKPEDYYKPRVTKVVQVDYSISNLATWAIENGSTYKEIKLQNPWILKRSLPQPSGEPYQIYVPIDKF